jgi:hypothetical protein
LKLNRNEALRILWERGDLDYRLEPQQLEAIQGMREDGVEIVYLDFTRRGSKTDLCSTFATSECIKRKGIRIIYGAAFQTDLYRFIIPAFETVLQDCPANLRPEFLESKKIYRFSNSSEIELVGLDKNPNALRGNGIRIIILDEAGFVNNLEYIYNSIILPATIRRKGQIKESIKIIVASTPPVQATNHFAWNLKLKAETEKNGFYLRKTIDEIPSISILEKERLFREVGGKTSITARREFFCEWIVDKERAVCAPFDKDKHVQDIPEPKYAPWLFVGDAGGVRDLTAAYLVAWDYQQEKIIFWDERWFAPETQTSDILPKLKEMIGDRKPFQYMDAPGQLQVDYSAAGFACALPPKDDFAAGLLLLRNAFHNDQVIVHPRCKLLIATLSSGTLNRTRTDYERTPALGHCDAAAAAIYAIRLCQRTALIPKPNHETHFYLPERRANHQLTQLGHRFK